MSYTYRILLPEEWDKLKQIYPEGRVIPSPETASAVVAESEGKIVGVLFMQLALHLEPLILTDPHVNWVKMKEIFDSNLPPSNHYFVWAPNSHIFRMCEVAGLTPLEGHLFEGMGTMDGGEL